MNKGYNEDFYLVDELFIKLLQIIHLALSRPR